MVSFVPTGNSRDLRVFMHEDPLAVRAAMVLEWKRALLQFGKPLAIPANDFINNPLLPQLLDHRHQDFYAAIKEQGILLLRHDSCSSLRDLNDKMGTARARPGDYKPARNWASRFDGVFKSASKPVALNVSNFTKSFHAAISSSGLLSNQVHSIVDLDTLIRRRTQQLGRQLNFGDFYRDIQHDPRTVQVIRSCYAQALAENFHGPTVFSRKDVLPLKHAHLVPPLNWGFHRELFKRLSLTDCVRAMMFGNRIGLYSQAEAISRDLRARRLDLAASRMPEFAASSARFIYHLRQVARGPVLRLPSVRTQFALGVGAGELSCAGLWLGGVLEEPAAMMGATMIPLLALGLAKVLPGKR